MMRLMPFERQVRRCDPVDWVLTTHTIDAPRNRAVGANADAKATQFGERVRIYPDRMYKVTIKNAGIWLDRSNLIELEIRRLLRAPITEEKAVARQDLTQSGRHTQLNRPFVLAYDFGNLMHG